MPSPEYCDISQPNFSMPTTSVEYWEIYLYITVYGI